MEFGNPILGGGGGLVRDSIRSPNYQTNTAGWTINRDGTAEFNEILVRGDVVASSFATDVFPNKRIEIRSEQAGDIRFFGGNESTPEDEFSRIGAATVNLPLSFGGANHNFNIDLPKLTPPSSPSYPPGLTMTTSETGEGQVWLRAGRDGLYEHNPIRVSGHIESREVINNGIAKGFGSLDSRASYGYRVTNGVTQLDLNVEYMPTVSVTDTQARAVTSTGTNRPSWSFIEDPSSGLYRIPGAIGLSVNGNPMLQLGVNTVQAPGMRQLSAGGQPVERATTGTNELFAETSSERLKRDIEPHAIDEALKLLEVDVVTWTAMVDTDDGPSVFDPDKPEHARGQTWQRPGWIAEEMARLHPLATFYDDEGLPIGVDRSVILADLTLIVKDLYYRVVELEAKER